jgi:predicted ATPase
MTGPVRAAYDRLVKAGELRSDPAQQRAAAALDRLAASASSTRLLARIFGTGGEGPVGVYLWGGVGRGKSMLMDLAFEHIEMRPKRRVHFDAFMLETHARLRRTRKLEQLYSQLQGRTRDIPEERMCTLERSLADLVQQKRITAEEAQRWCNHPTSLLGELQRVGV